MNKVFYTNQLYSPEDIEDILASLPEYELSAKTKNVQYYSVPCGFDIETSSFMNGDDKVAIMYEWTFGIDGYIIIGRTWGEFIYLLDALKRHFKLDNDKRLLIGVHNLAFEFQFIRKWFKWDKVFSIDKRKPVYAVTDGLEFRCTYILTNLTLEKVQSRN